MSVGPMGGITNSAAGSSLAQTRGSEVNRAQQDASAQERRVHNDKKAESAAGIGETDGDDHETAERDADGRRLWERTVAGKQTGEEPPADQRRGKDATGQSGSLLDLSG